MTWGLSKETVTLGRDQSSSHLSMPTHSRAWAPTLCHAWRRMPFLQRRGRGGERARCIVEQFRGSAAEMALEICSQPRCHGADVKAMTNTSRAMPKHIQPCIEQIEKMERLLLKKKAGSHA